MADFDSLTADPDPTASAPAPASFDSLVSDEDNSSIGQKALTLVEGAGKLLTGGISSSVIEPYIGNALLGTSELNPGRQAAREARNPISNTFGQVAGVLASPIGEIGGLAGGIAEVPIASAAIKYGLENALVQGTNETAKVLSQDPYQSAGSAAIDIGLAGLAGGALGAAGSGLKSLWLSRYGDQAASALDSAGEAINTPAPPDVPTGVTALKGNADEIANSLSALNIPKDLSPTILLKDQFPQTMEGNLAERGSFFGTALQKARAKLSGVLADNAEDTLSEKTGQSQAQIGSQIKKDISSKLLENLKPIEDGYKAAESDLASVPVSDDLKLKALDPIANHDYVKLDPDAANVAKRVSGQIENIENVSDLKKVRSLISSQLNSEYGSGQGGGPKAQILQTAKDALSSMRSSALGEAASNGSISPDALENIQSLDAQYSGFQNTVKQLGVEGGLGRANTARSLLSRFNDLSDESFTKKVFDTNDVRNMQFFKQNFPESFDLARRYKLSEIYDASLDNSQGKNGAFSTAKFLTQVRKLAPEAQQEIFQPEDLQRIGHIQNVHQAFPGTPNTSGTSYATAFSKLFSPEGVVQNLTDAAQYAWLKALPHLSEASEIAGGDEAAKLAAVKFATNSEKGTNPAAFKAMTDYIRSTIKGQNALSSGVNNLLEGAKSVVPTHLIPDQESRNKLQKTLDSASNPSNLLNPSPNAYSYYLPLHGTAAAQSISAASNYLSSLKPIQPVTSPLDVPPPINKNAQAKYNRALDIAQQPLMVLKHAKDGTLQAQDMQTLNTIYPGLQPKIAQLITNKIIENKNAPIPYNQRIGLNMLLGGAPLDGTMTPSAAQAIMHSAMGQQMAQQQAKAGQPKKASGVELKQINKVDALYQTKEQARESNRKA